MIPLLLTLPLFAAAELTDVTFDSIRARAVQMSYETTYGPGADRPSVPPHLTPVQLRRLTAALDGITDAQSRRLVQGLRDIDINFADTVSEQQWDAVIGEIAATARTLYAGASTDWGGIVDRMIQNAVLLLKDRHSAYLDPDQRADWANSASGTLTGIGARGAVDPRGQKIFLVYPISGAESAGLREGDVIIAVDGSPVAGKSMDEIISRVAGPEGTVVRLTVDRGGMKIGPFPVDRVQIDIPDVFSRMILPRIGYVFISQFEGNTAPHVFNAVAELRSKGAKGLIIDLRDDPGGLNSAVASIASYFLKDKAPIVSFKHQGLLDHVQTASGDGDFCALPVVVLINGNSASASEILASALKDNRPGPVVVGTRSFGKGVEEAGYPQPEDRELLLTENRWYAPSGGSVSARIDSKTGDEIPGTGGVEPDVTVDVPEEQEGRIAHQTFQRLFGLPVPSPVPDPVAGAAIKILMTRIQAGAD